MKAAVLRSHGAAPEFGDFDDPDARGDTPVLLVLGAGGIVGQIAVQAARLLGAGRVVAAARAPESLTRARDELGADGVVGIGGEGELTEHLREARVETRGLHGAGKARCGR